MTEACMFDILALPDDDLKRILPKASTRSLVKLVVAYPRAFGRTFLDILAQCMSAPTLEFIRDEMGAVRIPSYPEIRQAEMEIMKIIHEENLVDHLAASTPATPRPQ